MGTSKTNSIPYFWSMLVTDGQECLPNWGTSPVPAPTAPITGVEVEGPQPPSELLFEWVWMRFELAPPAPRQEH